MDSFASDVFNHHKEITAEGIEADVLRGRDGSFRVRMTEEGYNIEEPMVSTLVTFASTGEIEGTTLVKCGKVAPKEMNSLDVWPEAEEARLVFPEFDLSDFGEYNGMLSTPYVSLPFKVMRRKGEAWQSIKKGDLENRGYSDLSFRLSFVPLGPTRVKFLVSVVPGSMDSLVNTYGQDVASRAFPGIRVHEGRAKLVRVEEREQRWGLGTQPFYVVSDGNLDETGEVDLSAVRFPSSMTIKKAVVALMQSAVMPNWHWKRGQWDEAIRTKKYSRRHPEDRWPAPVEEDGQDTESEESGTEGESY